MGLNAHRTALISGANRGIGAAVAKRLFDAGWAVSLGMRKPEMPDWAAAAPERVHLFAYQAAQPDAGTSWAAQVTDRFGRIDAVVANAGIMIPRTIVEVSDDEMAQLLEINVQAPRRLVCPWFVATDMAMAITDRASDAMTQPDDLARVIEMLIDLPNEASVAEFCVNCQLEESF